MVKIYNVLDADNYKNKFNIKYKNIKPFDAGIPLLDISDKCIKEIYYFRWNTFFKHIKETPSGYVVTEFLPDVPWSGKYNTISCPAGHHFYEGRWIHKKDYLQEYARFWLTDGEPRLYSFWIANSLWAMCMVNGDFNFVSSLYDKLKENYKEWELDKLRTNGLFYQIDDRDGMEFSAGGSGYRPTINSYMYGDALAISRMARFLLKTEDEEIYLKKAEDLKHKINKILWDAKDCFYKTVDENTGKKAVVRELVGYIPWYFNLPDEDKNCAWNFLNDKNYFYAPYGPTTTEQNYPEFMKEYDHECLWNGPSWPFATSQTITALGNLLCNYNRNDMKKTDYYRLLAQYANEHYLTENGKTIPFIDENLDPYTGEWIARKILMKNKKPGDVKERGRDYNHSTFCDLVISGLAGIRPREDDACEINPLFSEDDLDYFCADGILYHSHIICVIWDKNGDRYGLGKGFKIYCDNKQVYKSQKPEKYIFKL